MQNWFTADPHFDHKRIIELCKRPFANVDDMNKTIIDNYNKRVKPKDKLYILGDFGYADAGRIRELRRQIKCMNIVFIFGNHDKVLKKDKQLCNDIFESTHDILDIKIVNQEYPQGQEINLCHYPFMEWNHFFYGAWHLFGHVHGNLSPLPGHLSCDVGVDCHNYEPIAFEELSVIMKRRQHFNAKSLDDGLRERNEPHGS